jgi:hypothetical protein
VLGRGIVQVLASSVLSASYCARFFAIDARFIFPPRSTRYTSFPIGGKTMPRSITAASFTTSRLESAEVQALANTIDAEGLNISANVTGFSGDIQSFVPNYSVAVALTTDQPTQTDLTAFKQALDYADGFEPGP